MTPAPRKTRGGPACPTCTNAAPEQPVQCARDRALLENAGAGVDAKGEMRSQHQPGSTRRGIMTTFTFKRTVGRAAAGGRMTAPAKAPARPAPVETSFDLLQRARVGDPEPQNELYRRYLPRLNRWARGQLPNGARSVLDTGDIVQE